MLANVSALAAAAWLACGAVADAAPVVTRAPMPPFPSAFVPPSLSYAIDEAADQAPALAPMLPAWQGQMDRALRTHRTGMWMGGVGTGVVVVGLMGFLASWNADSQPLMVGSALVMTAGALAAYGGGPVALIGSSDGLRAVEQATGWTLSRSTITAGWVSFFVFWPAGYVFAETTWHDDLRYLSQAGLLGADTARPLPPVGLAVSHRF